MPEINPGDVIQVRTDPGFTLDDAGATATDPSHAVLTWYVEGEPPTVWTWSGADNEIIKDGDGVFHADIPVTRAGIHHYRWSGDGAVAAAEESTFEAVTAFGG